MSKEKRGFRGIWFPAEVWLDERLTPLDKIILMEIDSLDNDGNCYASNEHLAKFCQCSQSKVSKAISKLKSLGYIEAVSFDGRTRRLQSCLAFFTRQTGKNYDADWQNLQQRIVEKNSREEKKKERKNPAETYDSIIDEFTQDKELREALRDFLQYKVASCHRAKKEFTNRALKVNLTKLKKLSSDPREMVEIVNQTLERSWSGFFPLKDECGTSSRGADKQQRLKLEKYENPCVGSKRYDNTTGITEVYRGNGIWEKVSEYIDGEEDEDIEFDE